MALTGIALLFLVFLVVSDDFLNDEVQESLGKIGVQVGPFRQIFEPCNLRGLSGGIRGRQRMFSFQLTHGLCVFEPLAQGVDEDRIKPVDAFAVPLQDFGGAGYVVLRVLGWGDVISQEPILLV
jgi:hypothetical protein